MKLTVQHVFDATPILANIMRENRPLPSKGKYRIARMHRKLEAEWNLIAERYNALVKAYDYTRLVMPDGTRVPPGTLEASGTPPDAVAQQAVPDDKMPEFLAAWKELAAEEIEVTIEPIPLDQLCIDGEEGGISIAEFSVLADLVEG